MPIVCSVIRVWSKNSAGRIRLGLPWNNNAVGYETTRLEGVKERGLIGADNPVARGDVKREETGKKRNAWEEEREKGRESRRRRGI